MTSNATDQGVKQKISFQLTSENFAENHDLKFDTVFTELGGQHF